MLEEVRVLLVEDEPAILALFAQALEAEGAVVIRALTVGGAVASLARDRVDVVVSDVQLPDGSITDLIGAVHAGPSATVPVLAMSGWPESNEEALGGIAAYLEKPFAPGALVEAIGRVLGSSEDLAGRGSADSAGG